jgi:hypothetical protein
MIAMSFKSRTGRLGWENRLASMGTSGAMRVDFLSARALNWRALGDDLRTLVLSQEPLWSAEILSEGLFAT